MGTITLLACCATQVIPLPPPRGDVAISLITFKDNGRTDLATWIWSAGTLMDLTKYQALKMTVKTIDGDEYLFVEIGGFNAKHGPDWKSPLYVLQRSGK